MKKFIGGIVKAIKNLLEVYISNKQVVDKVSKHFKTKSDTSNEVDTIKKPVKTPKVKIAINEKIREKYKNLTRHSWNKHKRDIKTINEVVVHATAGGSFKGIQNWMVGYNGKKAQRHKEYKDSIALFHYMIGKKGEIVEIINPEYWVWHSSSGKHDKETIGIEFVKSDNKNMSKITPAQYKAFFELLFNHIMVEYPITRITGHNYNCQKYKKVKWQCPGTFDWKKVEKMLKTYKYEFKDYLGILKYEIKKV